MQMGGLMKRAGESRKEARSPTNLLLMKANTRIGTWNVRTMYETGKTHQVAREMERYRIELLGISECRWNGSGHTTLSCGTEIIYSGHIDENHDHTEGVAIMMTPRTAHALIQWEPVSSRILSARFNSKGRCVTVIQCYAPTNTSEIEPKLEFYEALQTTVDKAPRKDIKILMGDMNAKIGSDNEGIEYVMGTHAIGERNENGDLFTDFCAFNELVIGGSIFPHKTIHKTTWTSPDGRTENQIDHITISKAWRHSLIDTRTKRGADIASDHQLLLGTLRIKLKAYKDDCERPHTKYNTRALKEQDVKHTFNISIQNKYEALGLIEETTTIDEHWNALKDVWNDTCKETLGKKQRDNKEWLSRETWRLVEERKSLKQELNQCHDMKEKEDLKNEYKITNNLVKKSARKDKRTYFNELATEAEEAAGKRDLKTLYSITKVLSGKSTARSRTVRDTSGKPLTKEDEQRQRWAEHFQILLNRPPPNTMPQIEASETDIDVNVHPPTKSEIIKALKKMKNGKAPGPDGIPPEALKINPNKTADIIHPLLLRIWNEKKVPADWKKGFLCKLPKKGDLSDCKNWRGIMLLSIPSKVLTRIILERLKNGIDSKLRTEQAGFRKDRSCTDHIATLRIIIEQSLEWQSTLYLNFIDFEKAFDSVDREVIWKILRHYGIPQVFINLIQELYEDATCQVIHNGKLTNPFEVKTGVRQGCLLSPMIFLMVVDWIMCRTTRDDKCGIKWNLTQYLEDLDFADDLCLLSQNHQHLQSKTNKLVEEAAKTGLNVNIGKTEVMRLQNKNTTPITIEDRALKDVEKFTYLGSVITTTGGTDEDINTKIGKARFSFNSLKPVFRSTAISLRNKLRIYNTNVKSVLLYGSETWKTTSTTLKKLQTFTNRCLRNILGIRWPERITNEELWRRTDQQEIGRQISERKWKWIGHTLRKPVGDITRQALEWNPQGKRKVGRPKKTWRRSCEEEMKVLGLSWGELKKKAKNRMRWRSTAEALCSTRNSKE